MSSAATKTDVAAAEWAIGDEVIRLRQWGTGGVHPLPLPPTDTWSVGTGETCSLRLADRLVSHEHARLLREHGAWSIRDLGSKNGLRYDGARRDAFVLGPGVEIGIGATTLIAESRGSMVLHGFLSRILGWGSDRIDAVDHALRSIRLAATGRTALRLLGDADLVPIAHALHRHTRGVERPFALCDPRRRTTRESVRSVANYVSGLAGFEAATGGSLCVRSYRLPADFPAVLARLRKPGSRVQLIVCADGHLDDGICLTAPIQVPPLEQRANELGRIVGEYARDAAEALDAPHARLSEADRAWVVEHEASSLSEIEKATLRLMAVALSRDLAGAAARLGMAPVSLSRWLGRRTPRSQRPR
jgi:hypothetical protein